MVLPARRSPLRRRRPIRRPRWGAIVRRQWGKDTHSGSYDTDVNIDATTVLIFENLLLLPSDKNWVRERAWEVFEKIDLDCIYHAFITAGMDANRMMAFVRGLDEIEGTEVRIIPEDYARVLVESGGDVKYPLVKAVLRLTHVKGGKQVRGPYEYWVVFDLEKGCDYVVDSHIFTPGARPGRKPKSSKQKTLGDFK